MDVLVAQPQLHVLVVSVAQVVVLINQQIYTIAKDVQVALDAQDAASQEYQQEQRHAQVQAELLAAEQQVVELYATTLSQDFMIVQDAQDLMVAQVAV